MGVPYEIAPMVGIVVPGGQTKTILVPFPSRSFISKIIVQQTDGSLGPFTLELFNHKDALEGTETSSSGEAGDRVPLNLYRVGPALTGDANGYLEYFSDQETGGHGLMFYCQDPPPRNRIPAQQQNLYVRITPSGLGEREFAMVIGGEAQIAGV